MPVTTGKYSNNETQIYHMLISAGLNTAAACGVLANLYAEAGFNPSNLQNSYESSLGYTDATYTASVNNGTYKNFSKDSAGYGICQWTFSSRKATLQSYAKQKKRSINDLTMQVEFLLFELRNSYKNLWTTLTSTKNTADGAYNAGVRFCEDFERPKGGSTTSAYRGSLARDEYWAYYSKDQKESAKAVENLGMKIVRIARSAKGLDYIWGGEMYDTNMKGADCSGFVYYCYKEAGVSIHRDTADGYYQSYKNKARKVTESEVCAGDLLFYENTQSRTGLDHVAIANGSGGRIHAKDSGSGIVEEDSLGNPNYILRILSDSQTSQDLDSVGIGGSSVGLDPMDYISLTSNNPYDSIMDINLSSVAAEGYDYGYLIDMTNGGEFRFYVPEFTEQAGAQWSPIDIRGRSVTVQSYNSTSSRVINISLDLYAGVGLYTALSGESGPDTVSRLHRDAYFVKSLEYPDYSNVVTRPPATVQLILGSAINIMGVVSNVSVEHLKPVDVENRSMYLKLSFTVTQTAVNPIDYRDVRRGQYSIKSTADIGSIQTGVPAIDDTNAPVSAISSTRIITTSNGNTYRSTIQRGGDSR